MKQTAVLSLIMAAVAILIVISCPLPMTPSSDANLSGIIISRGTLSPGFASGTTNYTASVVNSISSVTVTPTASDPGASVKVRVNGGICAAVTSGSASGSLGLNVGANPIDIQVTAADATDKTYTITVTRADPDIHNADIADLTISVGILSPAFAPGILSYTAAVNIASSVTVTPTASDSGATIQVRVNGGSYEDVASGSPSADLPLNEGDNTIDVKVTAGDLTTIKVYTITANRLAQPNVTVTTFAELQTAVAGAPGTIITINSNSLTCNAQLVLNMENSYITIQAGVGYTPVLDFSAMNPLLTGDAGSGINLKGSYYMIKGLTITNAPTKGMIVKAKMASSNTASHNLIENCVFSYNGDSGLSLTSNDITNDGSRCSNNYVKNCDSYMNADLAGSTGPGGNADGFSCKLYPGTGNVFFGCRSWFNSDDGFDFITTTYTITVENCWTWHNGDGALYTGWIPPWGGNGQGFKGGGGGTTVSHIFKNCIVFDTWYGKTGSKKGFDSNNNLGGNVYFNCVAYDCQYGFSYTTGTYGAPDNPVFKNCVAFGNTTNTNFSGATNVVEQTNDWNLGLTTTSADFKSINVALALAPRLADGSLPNNDFYKLTSAAGQLVDKGTAVGIPYLGAAPDLGAFECY